MTDFDWEKAAGREHDRMVDELNDLREAKARVEAERDYFRGAFKGMSEHASWLRKELEWYADEDNYVRWARSTRQDAPEVANIDDDRGKRARDALVGSASERETHCKLCGERLPPEYRAICPLCAAM